MNRFSCEDVNRLRIRIRDYMSNKRYEHTLGVERAAVLIGNIVLNNKVNELRVAALLHDIAKDLDPIEMLCLAKKCGTLLSDEDLNTYSALHSFAATGLVLRDFPEYATEDVLRSIERHTLGDENMTLFDKIIFISDYVEEGRTYDSCLKVREYLLGSLSGNNEDDVNIRILNNAIVMSIDYTADALNSKGIKINCRSENTKRSILNSN